MTLWNVNTSHNKNLSGKIIIQNYCIFLLEIAPHCTVTCSIVAVDTTSGYDPFVVPWEKIANFFLHFTTWKHLQKMWEIFIICDDTLRLVWHIEKIIEERNPSF